MLFELSGILWELVLIRLDINNYKHVVKNKD